MASTCNLVVVNGKPYGGADDFRLNCSGDSCLTLESNNLIEYNEQEYKTMLREEKQQIAQYIKNYKQDN